MSRFALGFTVVLAWLSVGSAPGQETIPIGVAKVDITPEYPTRLGGYAARKGEAAGVGQRIWAKAIAIGSDEAKPVVLIAVDSLGVPEAMVAELSRRLAKSAGLTRDALVVAATHTHSAPILRGVAPNIFGRPFTVPELASIDRYTDETLAKYESVALAALRDRRPSTLSWGQGTLDFAANRRTPGGPVDHSMPVLRVLNLDRTVRAIVVNYACHCTTLDPADNVVHGDWAGLAQEFLEQVYPGAVAFTVIGCGADANPSAMHGRRSVDKAIAHAKALVDAVDRVFKTPLKPLRSVPSRRSARIALPFDTLPTREALDALVKTGGYPGFNASTFLARLDRGEPIPDHVDYTITAWQFDDDLAMIFLPGEVVVDYALRLKRELDPARLWITAYTNDAPCYIPSERILAEGGYEGGGAMVYYGQPTRFKPGVEGLIVAAIHTLISPAFLPEITPPKLDPEAAREAIRTAPGLRVELVASEPMIQSPVAIDWGADGTLWVAEMRDYPMGIDGKFAPGGVIKALTDTDGDGRYDKATEFLTGVVFPTGVMAWRLSHKGNFGLPSGLEVG